MAGGCFQVISENLRVFTNCQGWKADRVSMALGASLDLVDGGAARSTCGIRRPRGYPAPRGVAQQAVVHAHLLHHAVHDPVVAQIGLEAWHDVDLAIAADASCLPSLVQGEISLDALDMSSSWSRGFRRRAVRRRGSEFGRPPVLLGIVRCKAFKSSPMTSADAGGRMAIYLGLVGRALRFPAC